MNWQATASADAGNMTKLNCEASGDETLNFNWFQSGRKITKNSNVRIQLIPKLSKSTLTILSTTRKDGGSYMCKVFNSFGKDEKTMSLEIRGKQRTRLFTEIFQSFCLDLQLCVEDADFRVFHPHSVLCVNPLLRSLGCISFRDDWGTTSRRELNERFWGLGDLQGVAKKKEPPIKNGLPGS